MSKPYLKSCPFCGCMAYVHKTDYPSGDVGYRISGWHDDDCYMEKCFPCFDSEEDAIRAWNRRDDNEA